MSRPICVPCAAEMRPSKNGFIIAFKVDNHYHQTQQGDAYKCPTCNHVIVSGFGGAYHSPETINHADLVMDL